ncbi:MAG: RibD family protein, partial [Pseudomonadota bacterium]
EEVPQPLRVVLDSTLRMSAESRMLTLPGRTLVLCARRDENRAGRLERAGARVVEMQSDEGHVFLPDALAYLADLQINEVLIEAGPTVAGEALREGVIDEVVIYMAPHLMGDNARGLFHLPWLNQMEHRLNLEIREVRQIGADFRITVIPER